MYLITAHRANAPTGTTPEYYLVSADSVDDTVAHFDSFDCIRDLGLTDITVEEVDTTDPRIALAEDLGSAEPEEDDAETQGVRLRRSGESVEVFVDGLTVLVTRQDEGVSVYIQGKNHATIAESFALFSEADDIED